MREPATLTHIAAPCVFVNGRVIQRCVVCGAKLADSLNVAMPVNPDGSAPVFPTWEPWALVQVEVGNPTRYSVLPASDQIPDDSCIDFV